jgi:uncharacterized protein (DUF3820 family)
MMDAKKYYINYVIMPFGKYKGEYVTDLPIKYLDWLYKNVELFGELEEAVNYMLDKDND